MSRPRKESSLLHRHRNTPLGVWSKDVADLIAIIRTPEGKPVTLTTNPTPKELEAQEIEKRVNQLKTLRIDPFHDHGQLCLFMIHVLFSDGDATRREECRDWLANIAENQTSEETEKTFKGIIKLKKSLEDSPHRNYYAYWSYHCFIHENGFEPSKHKLKKFILSDPKNFRKMPDESDIKGWTRMWVESGLDGLSD